MPVEIKELVVKVVVGDQTTKKEIAPLTKEAIQEIVAKCVEQVMQILQDKKDR